jgi:hypothetical protein
MRLLLCLVSCILALTVSARAKELQYLTYQPTGDALFDRYALAVLGRYEAAANLNERYAHALVGHFQLEHMRDDPQALGRELYVRLEQISDAEWAGIESTLNPTGDGEGLALNPAAVPLDVLRSWEQEFGQDPRYWQLLAFAAGADSFSGYSRDYFGFYPSDWEPLIAAIERGGADAATVLALQSVLAFAASDFVTQRLALQRSWRLEHCASATAARSGGMETPADYSTYYTADELAQFRQQAVQVLARAGVQTELELYNLAVKLSPDWAQIYYTRAAYYGEQGLFDLALADLEAGNAAPVNRSLLPFPLSVVYAQVVTAEATGSGNRLLLGLLLLGRGTLLMTTHGAYFTHPERHAQFELLTIDRKLLLLDGVHRQMLRQLEADTDFVMGAHFGFIRLRRFLEDVQVLIGPRLAAESRDALTEHVKRVKALEAILRAETQRIDAQWPMDELSEAYPLTAVEYLAQLNPIYENYQRMAEAHYLTQREFVEPMRLELAQFDLLSLKIAPR